MITSTLITKVSIMADPYMYENFRYDSVCVALRDEVESKDNHYPSS